MGSKLVKGHAFDFTTEKCVRCGMTPNQFNDSGEPQCTGARVEPENEETGTYRQLVLDDDYAADAPDGPPEHSAAGKE